MAKQTAPKASRFKVISDHAEATADGTVHAPLSVFELTAEQQKDPFNQERVNQGVFIETESDVTPLDEEVNDTEDEGTA